MTDKLARIAEIAGDRRGAVLVGAWALAEAIALPLVPDIAIGLLVLAVPRHGPRLLAIAIVAALGGTALLYVASLVSPDTVLRMLTALPGIDSAAVAAARVTVASGDPLSLASFGPGTPLKVLTFAWATGPGTPAALAVAVVLNRLTRIGPLLVVLGIAGRVAPGFLRRHEWAVLVLYAAFWIGTYLLYLGLVPGLR
jgi:hypothetical protein